MIVIGGSLGGMKAVRTLIESLPASFSEPIAVVLHRQKDGDDSLLEVLRLRSQLPLEEVLDKEPIRPGRIWIAPADYHLLLEEEHLCLSVDEPVSYARPSIDVLFESAADTFGANTIGVVLSGANHDGARGAAEIERQGGTIIIEDPETAECGIMPQAAVNSTRLAKICPLQQIAPLLISLSAAKEEGRP